MKSTSTISLITKKKNGDRVWILSKKDKLYLLFN